MTTHIKNNLTISTLAYIVIIITGLKLASGIILSFLIAFFLFIIFLPLENRLKSLSIPNIMGKDLGISTFIVFISMLIWGWIFGPFGMLLAVPLTMLIKIICENSGNNDWVSVVLRDNVKEKDIRD